MSELSETTDNADDESDNTVDDTDRIDGMDENASETGSEIAAIGDDRGAGDDHVGEPGEGEEKGDPGYDGDGFDGGTGGGLDADDFGEDDGYEEYDDDDDDEEDGGSSSKKGLIFAIVGIMVLLGGAAGGVGWFMFSSSDQPVVAAKDDPRRVQLSMPASSGSLNSVLLSDENPSEGTAQQETPTTQPATQPTTKSPTSGETPSPTAEPTTASTVAETASTEPVASLNSLNSLNAGQSLAGGVVVAAVSEAALAELPDYPGARDQSEALSPAPVAGLIEQKKDIGKLPKIAANGSVPWQVYARPVEPGNTAPRIALLIEGLGLSRRASLAVINKLPPEVSFVLSPYGQNLNDWVYRARLAGHELYMSLPMESKDFPIKDGGPLTLDTRIQLAENTRRLETVMARAQGYVGLTTMMGSQFLNAEGQIRQVLEGIKARGLMFVVGGKRRRNDATPIAVELNMPHAESEMYLDDLPRIQQIRENLDRLESVAKERGGVVAMARPYPVTIKSILDWIDTLPEKGVILAPVSAVAISQGG